MAEDVPVVERRKVVIEYTINTPSSPVREPAIDIRQIAALAADMLARNAGKNRPL